MARMIRLTPMYRTREPVEADDPGEWARAEHSIYVNAESIVLINEVAHDAIGASVLIPDEQGHGSFYVAESVTDVLDRINNVQNWPTG